MTHPDSFPPFSASPSASAPNGLRLRTLILLRWMAIGGQLAALAVAQVQFGLRLPLAATLIAIGVAALANLVAVTAFAGNRRLSETEAMLTLLLDISQLSLLFYLTGGINNPFALLILAPFTISATALALRTTVTLGGVSIALVTLLACDHVPLHDREGLVLELPALFQFGTWAAIVIGILFIGLYTHRVASEGRAMSHALLATQMALAREQKLTDLGGVVAAAAHELGTPLATIKLVSSEMLDEVDDPDLRDDIALIRDQADRCRDILLSMGRAGKDDLHLRQAPLEAVVREAAEPHATRGKTMTFSFMGPGDAPQPQILRRSEIIHGLRNLVQNAVDFAAGEVEVSGHWSAQQVRLSIRDDGPGYPAQVLGRIGEPFVRLRSQEDRRARAHYEGMGLGLFIAKTLLERTGAILHFSNAPEGGALVEVIWPRAKVEAGLQGALGENVPIEA